MFTAANIITLGIALLSVAATWGAIAARLARVERDVEGLSKRLHDILESREKQGKRIGSIEGALERLFERTDGPAADDRRRRRPTMPVPTDGGDE